MCATDPVLFEEKMELTGSATVGLNALDSHLVQQRMGSGIRIFGNRGHLIIKWQKYVWVHWYHCNQMVINIHAGVKAENGSDEKAGRGADSRSTSVNWWDFWRGLVKVKFWGIKEGTRVDNSILYNFILRVFASGVGSTDCNWRPEHVLEGNPESSHPSYDDDTQGKI